MILSSLPLSKKSRINSLPRIVDPIGLSPIIGATNQLLKLQGACLMRAMARDKCDSCVITALVSTRCYDSIIAREEPNRQIDFGFGICIATNFSPETCLIQIIRLSVRKISVSLGNKLTSVARRLVYVAPEVPDQKCTASLSMCGLREWLEVNLGQRHWTSNFGRKIQRLVVYVAKV